MLRAWKVKMRIGAGRAAGVICAFMLAGCGSQVLPPPTPGPWSQELEQARQLVTSDFERQILADDKITDQEFAEAFARFAECTKSKGVIVAGMWEDGIYKGMSMPSDSDQAVVDQCRRGTTGIIESYYTSMRRNPNNEDPYEVLARCTHRTGLAPESLTGAELRRLFETGEALPWDETDPRWDQCTTTG